LRIKLRILIAGSLSIPKYDLQVPLPARDPGPHLINGSMGPEPTYQTASGPVHPEITAVTNRQTDTDALHRMCNNKLHITGCVVAPARINGDWPY